MPHVTVLPRDPGPVTIEPLGSSDAGRAAGLETVLVIEDDATTRLALGCMVTENHRQVVLAHSADDALARLELLDPDIILCDYLLEGMNGREFCRKVKSAPRWCHVPIIMVTAVCAEDLLVDLLNSGADDLIIKPVRAGELRARMLCRLHARMRNAGRRYARPDLPMSTVSVVA